MIPTKHLKEIAEKMEDSPTKMMILSLPDVITREDLVSKMDLILPFLSNKTEVVMK